MCAKMVKKDRSKFRKNGEGENNNTIPLHPVIELKIFAHDVWLN